MKTTAGSEAIRQRTTKDIIQLSMGAGMAELIGAMLTALLNYYYVRTMGLSNSYFFVAQTIYAVYIAFAEPFIGYYTNRRFRFTAKLGKTTPFILLGGLFTLVSAILVYLTPLRAQLGLFFWMLGTLALSSTFFSMYNVNYQSLLPVVLQDKGQRIKYGTISVIFGTTFMIIGFIIPEFGDITSQSGYITPMLITAGLGIALLLGLLPAAREEPALTRELLRKDGGGAGTFFSAMGQLVRMKNFLVYILLFLAFQIISLTALSSLPYFAEYVMGMPLDQINSTRTLLVLVEFAGVFVSLPIWSRLAKKHEFKSILGYCGIALALSCSPMLFLSSLPALLVSFAFLGLSVGGFWSLLTPVFNDIMDEASYLSGGHMGGVSAGVRTFFARFALVAQAGIYLVVREVTGFVPGEMSAAAATPAIRFGIRFEMVGVSIILLVLTSVIFLIKYDLTGDKFKEIKRALEERSASAQ